MTRLAAGVTLAVLRGLVRRLAPGDRSWLARNLMQDRFHPDTTALATFFNSALDAWKNRQYAVETSGEAALLTRLRPFAPRHVLDVGANIGEWTVAACRELPDTTVHGFEIVDATAALLRAAVAPLGTRAVVNGFGLGDHTGTISLFFSAEAPTTASSLRDVVNLAAADQGFSGITEVVGQIRRGDDYLAERDIGRVGLLKIDVEGAEMTVLAGFENAFAAGRIDLVQFEYGRANLTNRVFLADFYRFFTDRGFVVGKLYPEGVAFKPYEIDDEDFVGPNYVACLATREDLIAALRCPPLRLSGASQ